MRNYLCLNTPIVRRKNSRTLFYPKLSRSRLINDFFIFTTGLDYLMTIFLDVDGLKKSTNSKTLDVCGSCFLVLFLTSEQLCFPSFAHFPVCCCCIFSLGPFSTSSVAKMGRRGGQKKAAKKSGAEADLVDPVDATTEALASMFRPIPQNKRNELNGVVDKLLQLVIASSLLFVLVTS